MSNRALIITANGFQDQEAIYPYYRLQEAGYEVDVVTADGKEAKGYLGVTIQVTTFALEASSFYDLLVIPGGVKAMEKTRLNEWMVKVVRDFHRNGKVIASICSGAQMLISAGICKGKAISGYPAMRVDIENAGAEFRNAVTSCERIVTAPHYRDLPAWMSMVFRTLHEHRAN